MVILSPAHALQQSSPFARHFIDSSAVHADRDIGSGADGCKVPEPFFGIHLAGPFGDRDSTVTFLPAGIMRYGEALHPGPCHLTVGVSNPSGLRRKEDILLGLGSGIWAMAETQLSLPTFRTCSGILRKGAQAMNRAISFHGGAPAPLRQGSSWAGKWTGVSVLSDVPAMTLDIPWPSEHWNSGRVLLTRHWAVDTAITVGTFYGFAKGPTWPKARQMSDQLLETFTKELVLGMNGVRMIMGDFNQEPGVLLQQQVWLRHGWRSAQDLAAELFNHAIVPTCKGTTQPDQIWLSPEAIQVFQGVWVEDHFMEHSTVAIDLLIPDKPTCVYRWPRPSRIPWKDLDPDWSPTCLTQFQDDMDTTEFMQQWARSFEGAAANHLTMCQGSSLPSNCFGRAQRLKPDASHRLHQLAEPAEKVR